MKYIKSVSVLLVFIIIFSVLCGCSKSPAESSSVVSMPEDLSSASIPTEPSAPTDESKITVNSSDKDSVVSQASSDDVSGTEYPPLPKEIDAATAQKMQEIFLAGIKAQNPEYPALNHKNILIEYIGAFNGCIIAEFTVYGRSHSAGPPYTVAGYEFDSNNEMLAYKNSELKTIEQAYTDGWLTEENVKGLHALLYKILYDPPFPPLPDSEDDLTGFYPPVPNIVRKKIFGKGIDFSVGVKVNIHSSENNYYFQAEIADSYDELIKIYRSDANHNKVDYIAKYNEAFFSNKALIVLFSKDSSGSDSVNIQSIVKNGNTLGINYERNLAENGTGDIPFWRFLIEVDKADVAGIKEISLYCQTNLP